MAETNETHFASPQLYELGYLLAPTISEEALGEEVQKIRLVLEQKGGTVMGEGFPALRALAYSIRIGNREGGVSYSNAYFGFLRFEMVPQQAHELKAILDKNSAIIRSLLIKTVKDLPPVVRTREPRPQAARGVEAVPAPHQELTASDEAQIEKGIEELLTEAVKP